MLLLAKKFVSLEELDKEALSDPNTVEDYLVSLNINLIIVGLIALVDPPRDDTAETVRKGLDPIAGS